jgi:SAM-dependent methyltransferase
LDAPPGNARNLRLDARGIWVGEATSPVSYPADGHESCYSLEEASFWFRHRNDIIVEVLRQFPPPGAVFDVGGGNGYVAAGIEQAGFPTVLVEPGPAGATNARQRGLQRVVCATVDAAGFAPDSLPAAALFDVLEHIRDDVGFLASLHKLLRPGGRIYLTVPAYPVLWSPVDVFAGHHRRYTARSLAAALRAAGFAIEFQSYFFWFLPLPVLLLRTLPGWLGWHGVAVARSARRAHVGTGGWVGWLLGQALRWERLRLARRHTLPVGGSCLAVGRRPGPALLQPRP